MPGSADDRAVEATESRTTRVTVLAPLSGPDAAWGKRGKAGIEIAYELAAPKNVELDFVDHGGSTDATLKLVDEYCRAGSSEVVILIGAVPLPDVAMYIEKGACVVLDFFASTTAYKAEHPALVPRPHPRLIRVPERSRSNVRLFALEMDEYTGEGVLDVLFVIDGMAAACEDIDTAMRKGAGPHEPVHGFAPEWGYGCVVVDMTLPFDEAVEPIRAWMSSRTAERPEVAYAFVMPYEDADTILDRLLKMKVGEDYLCCFDILGEDPARHGKFGEEAARRRVMLFGLMMTSYHYSKVLFSLLSDSTRTPSEVASSMYRHDWGKTRTPRPMERTK